jgi:23S rRNA (uracil-5-)-methyltransferase RumA
MKEIVKLSPIGLGRTEDFIHVPYTAIGDKVDIKRWSKKKGTRYAMKYELVEESSSRIKPVCPYFGTCGGCLFQHLSYDDQLHFKKEQLASLSSFISEDAVEVIPCPVQYEHKNRMDFVITPDGIGFRERGKWWKVVDVSSCVVMGEGAKKALASLRRFMKEKELAGHDLRSHKGFLRYMVVREGKNTGETMIVLLTDEGELPDPTSYFDVESIYWCMNTTLSDDSRGEPVKHWGEEYLKEEIHGVTYLIHPNSFFQTNTAQAEKLISTVCECVSGESVLDFYCGVGTFALALAKDGKKVCGVEQNAFAIEMARKTAEYNKLDAVFSVGDDKEPGILEGYDTVIVDPPRCGLHKNMIRALLRDKPSCVVYVSCNPTSLEKDLRELSSLYTVEKIVGVDMFPQTAHVDA